jgi:hypothetical protein
MYIEHTYTHDTHTQVCRPFARIFLPHAHLCELLEYKRELGIVEEHDLDDPQ